MLEIVMNTTLKDNMWLTFASMLIMLTAVGLAYTFPTVFAYVDPAWFGFETIAPNIYVESSMTSSRRTNLLEKVATSKLQLQNFYGGVQSNPRIFVCAEEGCYRRLGGGMSKGMALSSIALFISPRGESETILTHELSHVELHTRLAVFKIFRKHVPKWFDEGVAVVASDDRRYLKPPSDPDRCMIAPNGNLPDSHAAWIENAQSKNLYAIAACRVSNWTQAHGGAFAISNLLDAVSKGIPFDSVYGQK